jgi:hypothetical protein
MRRRSLRLGSTHAHCTLTKFATFLAFGVSLAAAASQPVDAASALEINAEVDAALIRFYEEVPAAKDLAKKAKAS